MIQVINRALDILEYIAKEPDKPKSLREISDHLELNAGTCANIIKTLISRKYIEKVALKKVYSLGARAYFLTGNENYKKDLIEASEDEMKKLQNELNESLLLAILNNVTRSVIIRKDSNHDLEAKTATDKKAYDSASGRILVATLSDQELEKLIERHGLPTEEEWEGVLNTKTFYKQIEKIRADQYAVQISKNQIIGIAVPIYQGGKVIASLSTYMPVLRYRTYNKKSIITSLKNSGKVISEKLG